MDSFAAGLFIGLAVGLSIGTTALAMFAVNSLRRPKFRNRVRF